MVRRLHRKLIGLSWRWLEWQPSIPQSRLVHCILWILWHKHHVPNRRHIQSLCIRRVVWLRSILERWWLERQYGRHLHPSFWELSSICTNANASVNPNEDSFASFQLYAVTFAYRIVIVDAGPKPFLAILPSSAPSSTIFEVRTSARTKHEPYVVAVIMKWSKTAFKLNSMHILVYT